ncbi:MAG: hypothetical protein WC774_01000 [Candidatus Gracilibacteria bacterium]
MTKLLDGNNVDKGASGEISLEGRLSFATTQRIADACEQKMTKQGIVSIKFELVQDPEIIRVLAMVDGLDIPNWEKEKIKQELQEYLLFRRSEDGMIPNVTHLSIEDRPYSLGKRIIPLFRNTHSIIIGKSIRAFYGYKIPLFNKRDVLVHIVNTPKEKVIKDAVLE